MTQAETPQRSLTTGVSGDTTRTRPSGGASLVTEQGRTTIADGVVAKIAGIAAREIDGVHQLVPRGAGAALSSLAQRVTGSEARDRGVVVEVGQREAAVDLSLIVVYGVSIPDVTHAVRQNIINRVREMTGLVVKEVNIDVADLFFPEDEQPPVEEATTTRRVE